MRRCMFVWMVGILWLSPAFAQTQPAVPPKTDDRPEGEKRFDALLRSMERALDTARQFSVDVQSPWEAGSGETKRSGTNYARIQMRGDKQFRIEAWSDEKKENRLLIIADGKSLIRFLPAQNIYTQQMTAQPFEELQRDQFTPRALMGMGIDFLIRKDAHGAIMTQTVRIEDRGTSMVDGAKLQKFALTLASKREVELHFKGENPPLPVEMIISIMIPVRDKQNFVMKVRTKLTWDINGSIPDDAFQAAIPKGCRKVDDLMEALLDGGVPALLGKPCPGLSYTDLAGKPVTLAEYKGKSIVVLFFWAMWAAPSIEDMPNINRFVAEYAKQGVTILAVNVGDKPEQLDAFLKKVGYKGQVVLDTSGSSLNNLKLNALPAVLLIGKDGTLQSFHRGSTQDVKAQLRADLDTLLKGGTITPPPK